MCCSKNFPMIKLPLQIVEETSIFDKQSEETCQNIPALQVVYETK
jgi:hypothetical protein